MVQRQARGDERRQHILRAAWRVMLREGIRGVRHRAVAEEAAVPLASTTYYFKDIQALLTESLQLFAEETLSTFIEPFWQAAESELALLRQQQDRAGLEAGFVAMGVRYIQHRLQQHRDHVTLEYAFWHAALGNPALRPDVRQLLLRSVALMRPWLEALDIRDPDQAARCVLATVRRIEYEGLIEGSQTQQPDWIERALGYQVKALW